MTAEPDQARVVKLSRWRREQTATSEKSRENEATMQRNAKTAEVTVTDITPEPDKNPISKTARIAQTMGREIFAGIGADIGVTLWNGSRLDPDQRRKPACTIVFNCPHAFANMVIRPSPLRLAEDYFAGKIDIEGDIYRALGLRRHFQSLNLSAMDKVKLLWQGLTIKLIDAAQSSAAAFSWRKPLRQWFGLRPDREFNKSAIAYHYDVSNAFYRLWLDRRLVYSCAYFENPSQSLEQAQANKLEHICRKLRLQPGENLLDVGCGWGSLMFWAAEHYDVNVHGVTLSQRQYEFVRFEIKARHLEKRVSVAMCDYRDLNQPEAYDKAVSVGMFEHVGLKKHAAVFCHGI